MPKQKKEDTIEKTESKYTPFVDADSLPQPVTNSKGEFVSYGKPHYAYRHTRNGMVEFIAIYRKPKGIVTKLEKTLKIKSGKNAHDAFFRVIKAANIPEID